MTTRDLLLLGILGGALIYLLTKAEEARAEVLPEVTPKPEIPITPETTAPAKAGITATSKPVTAEEEMKIEIPDLPPPVIVDFKTAPYDVLQEIASLRLGYEEIILYKPKPDEEYIDVYIKGGPFLFAVADPLKPLAELGVKAIWIPKIQRYGRLQYAGWGIFRVPKDVWYEFVEWMINNGYPLGHVNKAIIVSGKKAVIVVRGDLTPILYIEHYLKGIGKSVINPLDIKREQVGRMIQLEITVPNIEILPVFNNLLSKFRKIGYIDVMEYRINGIQIYKNVGYKIF